MKGREQIGPIEVRIETLAEADIAQLEPILTEHVKDRDTAEVLLGEINEIMEYMCGSKDEYGRIRTYFVAKDFTGKVLGCMAFSEPDLDMFKHFATTSEESAELLNAFVASDVQGQGVGGKLFNAVCDEARKEGKRQILINSGPRYKDSWGFYDKVCDENCGFIIGKYGEGGDAKTWRKRL